MVYIYNPFFFCVVVPFITDLCMLQMSRVLRLLELSHSSNHVNDGRPIAAHPSSGPLPPLGPPSPPLSPSLPARCPPFLPQYIFAYHYFFSAFLKKS
jgi:hypothetical protein